MICCFIDGLYRGVSYRGYLQYRDIVSWQNFCIVTSLIPHASFFKVSGESFDWSIDLNFDIEEKLKQLAIEPQYLSVHQSEPVGRGNFGIIYMGQLLRADKCITVAVKTLRGECPHVLHCIKRSTDSRWS